jgi:hypothetical protein
MNDYTLDTLENDLAELILAARVFKKLKAAAKLEVKIYGSVTQHTKGKMAEMLACMGERGTGISQLGMNEDDPDITAIIEGFNK